MISLTFGWTRRSVCVSSNAFFRSSSHGRMATIVSCGYFSASSVRDLGDPLVLVRRGERAR